MILPVELPDDLKIPEGCKAVLQKPKIGMQFIGDTLEIETARGGLHGVYVCFIPKHTWPSWLKCAAISRGLETFIVAHMQKPWETENGEWISEGKSFYIHNDYLADPLPALEVGECLFNPNFKEPTA